MTKNKFDLRLPVALFLLLISGVYCTKQDVEQEDKKEEPQALTLGSKVSNKEIAKGGAFNFKAKLKENEKAKHSKEKTLPVSKEEQRLMTMNSSTYSVGCFGMATGQYMDYGNNSYPVQELDFTNNIGGSVTISVSAYEVPNYITVLGPNYQIIAQSGWLETANYDGPWGVNCMRAMVVS